MLGRLLISDAKSDLSMRTLADGWLATLGLTSHAAF